MSKMSNSKRSKSNKIQYITPHTVNMGEVYKGSIHFSCKNEYWMITSIPRNGKVNIMCTRCQKIRTVFLSAISNDFTRCSTKQSNFSTHIIKAHCLIGLKSTRSCSINSHKIKDIIAKIPVKVCGKPTIETVPAWYCEVCNVYYILHTTYDGINGIPICDVKDFRTGQYISHSSDYDNVVTSNCESILHKLGYNVDQRNELSSQERHEILAQIVTKRQIAKNEIISLLQYYIWRNENNVNMSFAIEKWEEDLDFMKRFIIQGCDTIDVDQIWIK